IVGDSASSTRVPREQRERREQRGARRLRGGRGGGTSRMRLGRSQVPRQRRASWKGIAARRGDRWRLRMWWRGRERRRIRRGSGSGGGRGTQRAGRPRRLETNAA